MKVTLKLYRCVEFRTDDLVGPSPDPRQATALALSKVLPLAPGFRVFAGANVSTAGMEAMSFVISDAHVAQSGLVQTDPLLSDHVQMIDGALRSELMRIGIYTDVDQYQWRALYDTEGN